MLQIHHEPLSHPYIFCYIVGDFRSNGLGVRGLFDLLYRRGQDVHSALKFLPSPSNARIGPMTRAGVVI